MAPPPAATATRRVGTVTREPVRRRPVTPRRLSGPVRMSGSVAAPQPAGGLAGAAIGLARTLPDLRIIDRLTRGRAWIVVIGVLLLGIVAMQVTMLKLNSGIGEAVQSSTKLQRENAALRSQISQLSSAERIEAQAQKLGLVMPAAGVVKYVHTYGSDAKKAVRALKAPASPQTTATPVAVTTPAVDQTAPPIDQTAAADATDQQGTIQPTSEAPASSPTEPAQPQAAPTTPVTEPQQQTAVDPAATGGAAVAPPAGQ